MSVTSPLSTALSVSSSTSFHTATGGSPTNAEATTNISSPAERDGATYRDARRLPTELIKHIEIFLEEKMCLTGIEQLNSLLAVGGSRYGSTGLSAWVPPAKQIALLNTLTIHPMYTSRASEKEDQLVASQSLKYLRNLLAIVGPVNANLRAAFEFKGISRGGRHSYGADASPIDEEDDNSDDEPLNGRLANESAIWTRGQEFWKVVGWALNCSAAHPQRWKYWKPWLDYMIEVLETDFEERRRLDLETHKRTGGEDDCDFPLLRDSLLMSYLSKSNNRQSVRQMLRSILADGSTTYANLYQEVFEKETKSGLSASNKRKRDYQVVDLENDKFGDYLDDDSPPSSQADSMPPTPSSIRVTPRPGDDVQDQARISSGLRDSVPMRLQLFYLLALAAFDLPDQFVDLKEVYETFASQLKDLDISFFSAFISYTSSPLPNDSFVTLMRGILQSCVPNSAPSPRTVDPEVDELDGVSILMLQRCHLPFAANNVTADTNAKMSLVLESLLDVIYVNAGIVWTDQLQKSVERGIEARGNKVKVRKNARFKLENDDLVARTILDRSGQRMMTLMNLIQLEDMELEDREEGND